MCCFCCLLLFQRNTPHSSSSRQRGVSPTRDSCLWTPPASVGGLLLVGVLPAPNHPSTNLPQSHGCFQDQLTVALWASPTTLGSSMGFSTALLWCGLLHGSLQPSCGSASAPWGPQGLSLQTRHRQKETGCSSVFLATLGDCMVGSHMDGSPSAPPLPKQKPLQKWFPAPKQVYSWRRWLAQPWPDVGPNWDRGGELLEKLLTGAMAAAPSPGTETTPKTNPPRRGIGRYQMIQNAVKHRVPHFFPLPSSVQKSKRSSPFPLYCNACLHVFSPFFSFPPELQTSPSCSVQNLQHADPAEAGSLHQPQLALPFLSEGSALMPC